MFTTPEDQLDADGRRGGRGSTGWILRSCGAAAVTLVLLAAPACAVDPTPAEPSGSVGLPQGVTVELRQSRADVAARQAMIAVYNGSALPLAVGAVAVADPRFSQPAERIVDRVSSVAAGATVDVRVQLAPVACDVGDDAVATVTLAYETGDRAGVAVVPIVDTVPFVADLHARECVQEKALRSATIELVGFTPSPPGDPAILAVAVTPRPGIGDLRILGIRETNLLTFPGAESGTHRLDLDQTGSDREAVTVDVPLLPLRCDAHAVQEDKRGTVFRLFVEIGGGEGSFDLAASPEMRGEILGWIADWCGFGGG